MIVSFSQLGKHGKLGNQLFQVAATMGIAERNGGKALFPSWPYSQYFQNHIPTGPPAHMSRNRVNEQQFHYYDVNLTDTADLYGYFQSEKYFGSNPLRLKPEFVAEMKARLNIWDKETICIQIRRGDYVLNENYYQIPITYFLHALTHHFPNWKNSNILVISDDIEYCRVHLECLPNVTFHHSTVDIEDMALGSNCDHFIISNSTFGWWTAYFGEHRSGSVRETPKVVHPGRMFEGKLSVNSTVDFWPKHWYSFDSNDWRLDLTDVTFTIPVFHDHLDRRRNLDLSLCLLQKNLDAHWIVCEQGGNKFEYMSQFAEYMKVDTKQFHRTYMLNQMAKRATTPIVVNWDCDVFVPPIQLWMATELIRTGIPIVYPFDGRFARMQRQEWFGKIQQHLDIGIVRNTHFKGGEPGHMSAGGAVMFDREVFLRGGMENQRMISFGPEDWERHDRFHKLGYTIARVKGSLYHMNHFVGPNSSSANPHFKKNHAEYLKIKEMTKEELENYIAGWDWLKETE